MVLRRALKEGQDALIATKAVLTSNDPRTSLFLQLLPENGELPSLKQLEGSAKHTLRDWLRSVSEQCTAAECQPLEMFTRSTLCSTHLRAMRTVGKEEVAARQQRLQAVKASLPVSSTALLRRIVRKLCDRTKLLAQHAIAPKTEALVAIILLETILMLDADQKQLGAPSVTAGSSTSFTVCIDHMLPGVGAAWQIPSYLLHLQQYNSHKMACLKIVRGLISCEVI